MQNVFDITEFGAVSDGKTDCSEAIQKALDAAGAVCGAVIVPPGKFLCKNLKMHRGTCIRGYDAWSFRTFNSSVLQLADEQAECVLDLTGAVGAVVRDLGIDGRSLGGSAHGVMINHPIYDAAGEEDTPTVENCRIGCLGGDAIHFNHVWCSTVRNNMLYASRNGFYEDGWDLFCSGNWFSGNRDCGVRGGAMFSSALFSGNRIEWNIGYGMYVKNCKFTTICNNQFDRAGKTQLRITCDPDRYNRNISVSCNTFNRSGTGEFSPWMDVKGYENAHIFAEECVNLNISDNSFHTGRDGVDGDGNRRFGPGYGIVFRHLRCSIIKDNVMQSGSVIQNLADLGEHEEQVVVKDNLGDVMESPEKWTAMLGDKPVEFVRSYFSLTDEEKIAMGLPLSFRK